MNNTIDHIRNLLNKCSDNTATEAELQELQTLLDQPDDVGIATLLKENWNEPVTVFSGNEMERLADSILDKIQSSEEPVTERKKIHNLRTLWIAAASLVLLVGAGTWLWVAQKKQTESTAAVVSDLPPGHDGAILTLADGQQIILDSMNNGIIASQQGTAVSLRDGQVIYAPAAATPATIVYNTMSTPRGRQFQLMLPDGTRVWLNAESSIRFPASFTGNYRDVSITGEVYFEVAKRTTAPFRVNIGEAARIEVLGTHFNVNAYGNEEAIHATLLNGSVKIIPAAAKAGSILKPGEQAQLPNIPGSTTVNIVKGVDIDRVMAWKNGAFNFEGLGLQEVLRQLERWYDIRVVYKATPADLKYRGGMDRNVKFSDILDVFREMGVKYEWDGKTLTVN